MLDKDVIAQLIVDIGEDVFLRLSQQFLDETLNRLSAMSDCHRRQAWTELARHAHSLKSTAQSFGLKGTGLQARDLQMAADNLDLAEIEKLLPPLLVVAADECREFAGLRQSLGVSSR